MPATNGWKRADVIFATARRIPTCVFVKPLDRRNTAAYACNVQNAAKYVTFNTVYPVVQSLPFISVYIIYISRPFVIRF